jgi:hypothetical protein
MKYLISIFLTISFYGSSFAQLENNLIARYYFNAGDARDEVGNNDGTVVDAILVKDRFNNPQSAYFFDGNGYITFGDKPEFQMGSGSFAISFWMKKDEFTFQGYPIVKRATGSNNQMESGYGVHFTGDGKDMEVLIAYDDFSSDGPGKALIDNLEWHHYVISYDRRDKMKLYIDNYLIDEIDIKPNFFQTLNATPAALTMGVDANDTENFVGTVDDVRIYKRSLNASDVSLLYEEEYIPTSNKEIQNIDLSAYLYPNPADNFILIANPLYSNGVTKVFDTNGKLIASEKINSRDNIHINVASWKKGLYLIKLQTEDGQETNARFVVQ